MKNKLAGWIIIVVGFFLMINLIVSIGNLVKKGDIVGKTQERLEKAKKENTALKEELEKVQSQAYIEKQAREKLNLGKPDEIVVILPSILPTQKVETKMELPNWRKWLAIFM